MKIVSLNLANKEYSVKYFSDSFADKIHVFFLSLAGQKLNLLITDGQGKPNIYTMSKKQYEKVLKNVFTDALIPSFSTSELIKIAVKNMVLQTKLKDGIVFGNSIREHFKQDNLSEAIYQIFYSKIFYEKNNQSFGLLGIEKRLEKLGVSSHEAQQKLIMDLVTTNSNSAAIILRYLLSVAKFEKKEQDVPKWTGEPCDPGIFIPGTAEVKSLFGVGDFIKSENKAISRSFLSLLLEKIALTDPALKMKIKENLPILENFAKNFYTNTEKHGWCDDEGRLATGNYISYELHVGLKGGYLDHMEFLDH